MKTREERKQLILKEWSTSNGKRIAKMVGKHFHMLFNDDREKVFEDLVDKNDTKE